MKTSLLLMIILLSLAGWWQRQRQQEARLAAWRDARFLNPEVTQQAADEALRLASMRPSDFAAEVKQATEAEFQLWEKQFEKGAEDRQQRLLWQHQTATSLKTQIKENLLTEAWLEQRLQQAAASVSEAEVRQWFITNAERLRIPLLHRVSHLFLSRHVPQKPDRSLEIRTLRQRLTRGEKWAELTAQHSEDERSRHRAGDLGWLSRQRMPADFMGAVESQVTGILSQPVQTKLGWHLILVTERKASRLPQFDEVRHEIAALLQQEQREAALKDISLKVSR